MVSGKGEITVYFEPGDYGSVTRFKVNEIQQEKFKEFQEEYGFSSESAACRFLLELGMNSAIQNDPRDHNHPEEADEDVVTIRELIPEGEENKIRLINDDDDDALIDVIEDQLLTIVNEDSEVTLDGWEVYR